MRIRDQLAGLIERAARLRGPMGPSKPSNLEERRLQDLLDDARPEDLADAIQEVDPEQAAAALARIEPLTAAQVLVEAPTPTVRALLPHIPDETLAAYLDILPMDDAIDLHEEIQEERWERLMGMIPVQDAAEIRRLMAYPPGTVGRLMTEAFFDVSPQDTMEVVLEDLRSASANKYETVNDIYVLDEDEKLVGVFSLRKALRAHPKMLASEVMSDDVLSVQATDTDEESARTMARYGLYALPVVDQGGRMKGLFTGDDAQTILREAETKDVLALGGVSGPVEAYLSLSVWQLYARRMPWLLALFVAETFTGQVLRHYYPDQGGAAGVWGLLMLSVPLIIGAGGNSGSQVTTTITRALALGEVSTGDWGKVMTRELGSACLVGLTLGVIASIRGAMGPPIGWSYPFDVCLLIGVAMPAIILWASVVGSLLPIAAKKLGLDPAVLSAPFITTFVDATGLIIYFELARRIVAGLYS
jgi:magnesium transporter